MKIILTLSLWLVSNLLFAQQSLQEEIDQQVWLPFKKAWEAQDAKAYNSLHTDDILRVTPQGIILGSEYKKSNIARFEKGRSSKRNRTLEFWFEHRIADQNVAYEVGYFKITDKSNPEHVNFFGRFHIVLRKVDGTWRIAQDWDTSNINGHQVSEEDYQRGKGKRY